MSLNAAMPFSQLALPLTVRPLRPDDVEHLLHIQTICYGAEFLESKAIFAQRLACRHHCSIGVAYAHQAQTSLLAYLAAYWSSPGKITPLNGPFTPPVVGEQVLYLHDMSVLPELAGQGIASHLVQHVFQQARERGVRQAALVSVQGSQAYWERQGFSVTNVNDAQQFKHLQSYGEGACYMSLQL
jgi:GNAT superfamily N-acetyltransferase